MASNWHILRAGQQTGPFSSKQLKDFVASGRVEATDMVWKEGMSEWVAASRIKGLFPNPVVEREVGAGGTTQTVACPHCGCNIACDSNQAGKVFACPHCAGQFQMPTLEFDRHSHSVLEPEAPAADPPVSTWAAPEEKHPSVPTRRAPRYLFWGGTVAGLLILLLLGLGIWLIPRSGPAAKLHGNWQGKRDKIHGFCTFERNGIARIWFATRDNDGSAFTVVTYAWRVENEDSDTVHLKWRVTSTDPKERKERSDGTFPNLPSVKQLKALDSAKIRFLSPTQFEWRGMTYQKVDKIDPDLIYRALWRDE